MNRLNINIGKGLDWINSNLSRIKTIGIIVLVLMFIISAIQNGIDSNKMNNMVERITGLNVRNDILLKDNKELTEKLLAEQDLRNTYKKSLDSLLFEKKTLAIENKNLKKKLADIPTWLLKIPTEKSYEFLKDTAYPYSGELKFPFNEPQVKGIRKSYEENKVYEFLIDTMNSQLANCEQIVSVKDSIYNSLQSSMMIYQNKSMNSEKIIENYAKKEDIYKDNNKQLKRRLIVYKTMTAIGIIIVLILAL